MEIGGRGGTRLGVGVLEVAQSVQDLSGVRDPFLRGAIIRAGQGGGGESTGG
jgi:hypothetical protein